VPVGESAAIGDDPACQAGWARLMPLPGTRKKAMGARGERWGRSATAFAADGSTCAAST
jgi:hypothetical protein